MSPSPGALSPQQTKAGLSALVREVHGADARLEHWTVSPVSKRGKHRTMRYDVVVRAGSPQPGHHQWVGKLYERDAVARKVATILGRLAANGWTAGGDCVVPGVVGYYEAGRLLFLTLESGGSVIAAMAQHPQRVLSAIGRAVAALHAAPIGPAAITSASVVLGRLRRQVDDLRARFPHEAASLGRILIRLERQAPPEPPVPCFLHGSLGPAQLRWRAGQIVFLDFDDCTWGDPALDLGNLLTQIRRLTLRKPGKLPEFDALRRGILGAYERVSPHDPALDRRVAWYERIKLVRKIHFLASDTTRPTETEAATRRPAEATRLLGELRALVDSGQE